MTFLADPFIGLCSSSPVEAVRLLAREWRSVGSEPFGGHRIVDGVPALLRWLHDEHLAIARQNRWVAPSTFTSVDGKLVFYVENQSVCEWATDAGVANGPVWVRDCDKREWRPESPTLEAFVLQAITFELIAGSDWGGIVNWCDRSGSDALRARLHRFPFRRSGWLGELFAGDDLLLTMIPNDDGDTLWAGARSVDAEDMVRHTANVEFD